MTKFVFDLESTGLDPKASDAKVHIVCMSDMEGNKAQYSNPSEAVDVLNNAELIIGHYIQFFDIPYLEYVTKKKITAKVFDTKVVAGLMFPNVLPIPGTRSVHSLEAWGKRLGVLKGDYAKTTDWKTCSPEMIDYCHQDVEVTRVLYEYLVKQGIPNEALKLETEVATIIQQQMARGITFDKNKAIKLVCQLMQDREERLVKIKSAFPTRVISLGEREAMRNFKEKTKGVKYTDIEIKEFNPDSNADIAEGLLYKYNWRPQKLTPTGKPKVDISVLSELAYPEAKLLLELSTIGKIQGYVSDGENAWLKLEKNGKIYGQVNTTGVVTGRMSHRLPNMAQVPAKGKMYGEQCRELFTASIGKVLVGCDASALELRCLAHYLAPYDKGRLTKIICEADIHQANADILGCDRNMAKHFIYAFIYGAQAKKLAEVLGCSSDKAKKLKEKFENGMPGFKEFYKALTIASKRGYVIGLDGRKIMTPVSANRFGEMEADYKRLNYLLQSAGAIVMKKALTIACKESIIKPVLNIHDEIQCECLLEDVDVVGNILVNSIREAGKYFNMKCPMTGEYKSGLNWSLTH